MPEYLYHFAAPGKRVQSVNDPGQMGTVLTWLEGRRNDPQIIVQWDGDALATACYAFDLDIPETPTSTPTPKTLGLIESIEAVKASCAKHGLDDYNGEAVAFLEALLAVADGSAPDAAVRQAFNVSVVEIVRRADDGQPEEVVKTMTFPNERLAEKAESGANINLDHERYFTRSI